MELLADSGRDITFIGFSFILISAFTTNSNLYCKAKKNIEDEGWIIFASFLMILLYIFMCFLAIILSKARKDATQGAKFLKVFPQKLGFAVFGWLLGFIALSVGIECL